MQERSSDLKSYLHEELVLRKQKNPAYSLRSFARSLDISPSFLSKILNGKRRVTENVCQQVLSRLDLEESARKEFLDSIGLEPMGTSFEGLELDQFKVISDWYHYALLELTKVKGFKGSPSWIAAKLGVNLNVAKSAIHRLLKLSLIERKGRSYRLAKSHNTTTKNNFTDLAFKKMQDELLTKSKESLWETEWELRDHSSICMAVHLDDIPEVKNRLKKFRREMCKFLERERGVQPTEVYNLSLSFFPLSKEDK